MPEDPIVAETRAARERLVGRFNGDLDALWRHLKKCRRSLAYASFGVLPNGRPP